MYHAPDSSVSSRSTHSPSLSFSSTGCLPMPSPPSAPSRRAGPLRDEHDGGRPLPPRRRSGEGAKADHAEEYARTGMRRRGVATAREMRIVAAGKTRLEAAAVPAPHPRFYEPQIKNKSL